MGRTGRKSRSHLWLKGKTGAGEGRRVNSLSKPVGLKIKGSARGEWDVSSTGAFRQLLHLSLCFLADTFLPVFVFHPRSYFYF